MIVLDANVIIRYLIGVQEPTDRSAYSAATRLFDEVIAGRETVTANDAVIAEVMFILDAKDRGGFTRPEVASRLAALISHPGVSVPRKTALLEALAVWTESAKISFVDALTMIQARQLGCDLATFDVALARRAGVVPLQERSA